MATMRIYVGGLGETVREEDIQNTFSKLGAVESVEFVRTKGRGFAYIDFVPSSDKSAAKLFSTYNGCSWKGGKLRLEKAKEHYLERMKREWAEDTELANKTQEGDDAVKKVASPGGHEETLDETSQIRMYIPGLRKVRPLPYKGTGKHKYSFQRLQVPSRAAHFCDCEDHAVDINTTSMQDGGMDEDEISMMNSVLNKVLDRKPHPAASRTSSQVVRRTSIQDGGMDEDEINMMGSVLNKLLDRGNHSAASEINSQVASQRGAVLSDHLLDDQNHKDDSTDDDNIIINAVARPNDMTHLLQNMKKQTGLHTKMARPYKLRTSADVRSQNGVGIQKGKNNISREKGNLFQVEGSGEELEFAVPNRKRAKINQPERKSQSLSMKEESGCKKIPGNTLQERGQAIENDHSLVLSSPLVHGGISDSEAHPEAAVAAAADNAVKLGTVILESPAEQLNEVTNTDPKHVTSKKSSWMRLVGSASHSPFSISQILPVPETEKSKKGMPSSSAQRNDISYSSNPTALKRKRENTDGDFDSGKKDWVPASTSECFNMRGFGKKNHKLGI